LKCRASWCGAACRALVARNQTYPIFAEGDAGALPVYWENNWTEQAGCKLVGYQTPFSGLKPGDYVACVSKAFPHVEIVDDARE